MDHHQATPARERRTCWTLFLKYHRRFCHFIKDISHLSAGIEFLKILASPGPTGGHSYVFQVRLEGKIYALKLFNLTQPHWSASHFERNAWDMDPFIVECQVYDYLIEKKLVGMVGPYCYGWLMITKAQENLIEQKLRKSFDWRRREDTMEDPIRGLLLEYVEGRNIDEACITEAGAKSLRDQLNHLHSLDIAHGDLYPRNIMVSNDGRALLIDFSAAKLYPHINGKLYERERFLNYVQCEKRILELVLFRLQRQLKRHEGMVFTEAQTEEEAYGGPVHKWTDKNYAFVD
ncbi:hypothetical protein EMCG_03753 [[Emmonsia] crescens]|uniref:Protein kinase domain-containing protein n=1 Tax=[Emmonsia] crescens TaxID=73230 RepID=A0A0G2IZS9_9EURO|nr:hypothetical protein EMCG_03753 [Emmonsia crescens UAMH 3008]